MMKRLVSKRLLILAAMAAITVVLGILYAVFGKGEEKLKLLILTPVIALLFFGFFTLLWKVIKKVINPSRQVISVFMAFFAIVGLVGFVMMIITGLTTFPNVFSPSLGACISVVFCALTEASKQQ